MILYLLKSTLCLALMLAAYFLFLEKEKMYRFNRFYLLFSIVFSYLIPLNSITVYSHIAPVLQNSRHISLHSFTVPANSIQQANNYLIPVLLLIYCLVTSGFLFRFIKNICLILLTISKNEVIVSGNAKIVLLQEEMISHTFLNYIFISEKQYHNSDMEKEVFTHELSHVQQQHTLDVLFIELLQIFCWFNPVLILYKKAIMLNHEFLADEAVLATYNDVKHYQLLLIDKITPCNNRGLTSSFNYLVTKRRLLMMKKAKNNKNILFKKLLSGSLVILAVYLFSTRVEAKSNFSLQHKLVLAAMPNKHLPVIDNKKKETTAISAISATNQSQVKDTGSNADASQTPIADPVDAEFTAPVGLSITDSAIYLSIDKYTTQDQLDDYKTQLAKKNITLDIPKIEFDADNNIKSLSLAVNCNDGFSGSASARFKRDNGPVGFYRIYRKNVFSPFGTGGMDNP